jgi:hypothetical protein
MKQLLVISLALLVSACSVTPKELEQLDKVFQAYEHSMRWSRLELVAQYYKDPPTFNNIEKQHLKNIKITSYKVLNTSASTSEALQTVAIRYFNTNNAVEREITDTQKWVYDREKEQWSLTSPFPDFR